MRKLISKSKLTNKIQIDTVKASSIDGTKRYREILLQAQSCWNSLEKFRRTRDRCKRYCFGDQWGDKIEVNGKMITEGEYIKMQGGIPLKNNLIRRLVRSLVSNYRGQAKEPTCYAYDRDEQKQSETMTIALQANYKINEAKELHARSFEDFLIGGGVFHKETFNRMNDRTDCFTYIVNPNLVFFDTAMRDVRHNDLSIIGEIHNLTFEKLCSYFAHSQEDFANLKQIYSRASNGEYLKVQHREDAHSLKNIDFTSTYDTNLCRVIEVWSREQKPRYSCHDYLSGEYYKIEVDEIKNVEAENQARINEGVNAGMEQDDIPLIETEWYVDDYWYYRFLTPFGECLEEGETPYKHKSHPYTMKLYPYIDGEIHPFVADFIDQQRYVNRLITTNDFVIKSSAKGVLMLPSDVIPEDMTREEFAEEWARPDGLIVYNPSKSGKIPEQIANKSTNVGLWELLQLQINLMEEISGVSGAMQGKQGFSGQSASLYQQQQQNSNTSLLDLFESYSSFVLNSCVKKVKNMQQFYTSKRIFNIAGKNAVAVYDPEKINDIQFEYNIIESADTPAYRMLANDWLMDIYEKNAISTKQLLRHCSFPFADELLQSIEADEEAMAQGQAPQGVPQELKDQIGSNVNPEQLAQLQAMMKGGSNGEN